MQEFKEKIWYKLKLIQRFKEQFQKPILISMLFFLEYIVSHKYSWSMTFQKIYKNLKWNMFGYFNIFSHENINITCQEILISGSINIIYTVAVSTYFDDFEYQVTQK